MIMETGKSAGKNSWQSFPSANWNRDQTSCTLYLHYIGNIHLTIHKTYITAAGILSGTLILNNQHYADLSKGSADVSGAGQPTDGSYIY